MRTLLAIEACGKLDDFGEVFDIELYRKHSFIYKCNTVIHRKDDFCMLDNFNFCAAKGLRLPSQVTAFIALIPSYIRGGLMSAAKGILRRILSKKIYAKLKAMNKKYRKAV